MSSTEITTINYKKGAYIVMEGEKSTGTFFIVQTGVVRLIRTMTVPEIAQMDIREGEVFEVESALTNHLRLFSAIALTDCTIIVVPQNMFDVLIQKKPSLVQKIILMFSQRMRKLDHTLTQLTLENEEMSNVNQLIAMAKYYEKVELFQSALFCYYHYIKNNPTGKGVQEVKESFDELSKKTNNAYKDTYEEDIATTNMIVKAEHIIFAEGMPGDRMFFIQDGSVKISKVTEESEITLAVLHTGNFFGEMALLESKPRSANATASTDCSLLVISNENFPLIIKRQPKLITRLTSVLAERIWFVYRQISNVVLPKGQERLFDALLMFMEQQGVPESLKRTVELKTSPKDFIRYTGMDPQVANNILKEFINDNIIMIKNNNIIINNTQYVSNRANHFRDIYEAKMKKQKRDIESSG